MSEPGQNSTDKSRADEPEPLSATAMFFSSFAKEAEPEEEKADDLIASSIRPDKQPGEKAAWPDEPLAAAPYSPAKKTEQELAGDPESFTQIFRALEPSAVSAPEVRSSPSPNPLPAEFPGAAKATPGPVQQLAQDDPLDGNPYEATSEFFPPLMESSNAGSGARASSAGSSSGLAASSPPRQQAVGKTDAPPTSPTVPQSKKRGFSSPGLSDAASSAGDFHQVFPSSATAPPSPVAGVNGSAQSSELATSSARPQASPPPPAVAAKASAPEISFTQLFSALPTSEAPTAPATAPPGAPVSTGTPFSHAAVSAPVAAEGSFTQMFSTTPATPTAPVARIRTPPTQPQPLPSSTGSADTQATEGSFTGFFSTKPAGSTPERAPVPDQSRPAQGLEDFEWSRPPAQSAPAGTGGTPSVTELFRTLSAEDAASARPAGPYAASPASSQPLEHLSSPTSFPRFPSSPFTENVNAQKPSAANAATPFSATSGGVTQLIRMLTEEVSVSPSTPAVAPAEPERSAPAGPGEFTRIISGEMLRAAAGVPALANTPPASAAAPAFPVPGVAVTPPGVTKPSIAMPAIPAVPSAHVGGGSAGVAAPPMPHASAAAPSVTPPRVEAPRVETPKVPTAQAAVGAVASAAAPKSKLQQMLPLILVLNAFLLVVLILVVFFALHRR